MHTTRTVKRVPDSEQKRADSQKLPRNSVGQTCRTSGRQTVARQLLKQPSVPTPPMAKESDRPSEDAGERRSAKAQDLNPPTVPHVIRVPRAADTENEPSSSSSRPMETEDGGARDNTASDDCPQAPVPAPSNPMEQATGG